MPLVERPNEGGIQGFFSSALSLLRKPEVDIEYLKKLLVEEKVEEFNQLRPKKLDLSFIDLSGKKLCGVNFDKVTLDSAKLIGCDFTNASFKEAGFVAANLKDCTLINTNAKKAVFSRANFFQVNATGMLAEDADFICANIYSANFNGATLRTARLHHALIGSTTFDGADLFNAFLIRAQISDCSFEAANLTGVTANQAYFNDRLSFKQTFVRDMKVDPNSVAARLVADGIQEPHNPNQFPTSKYLQSRSQNSLAIIDVAKLKQMLVDGNVEAFNRERPEGKIDLQNLKLNGRCLNGANLKDADLRGCDFSDTYLEYADLEGANLARAKFYSTKLRHACLKSTHCAGVSFDLCDFTKADLCKSNLSRCSFTSCNFTTSQGCEANLAQVKFTKCDCSSANFYKADLRFAWSNECNWNGSNLTETHLFNTAFDAKCSFEGAYLANSQRAGLYSEENKISVAFVDAPPPLDKFPSISKDQEQEKAEMERALSRNITLPSALAELDALVGLEEVKIFVKELANFLKVQRYRSEHGLPEIQRNLHFVFQGDPGTGKTSVARILGKILYALGYLEKPDVVEANESSLVAGFVGQTATKTEEIVKKAMGGVLFVDEAYTLAIENKGGFAKEAIAELLLAMENNRGKFSVIVAGYPELMRDFVNSNPGLKSRFTEFVNFKVYSDSELVQIFRRMLDSAGFEYNAEFLAGLSVLVHGMKVLEGQEFANGRSIRNAFEKFTVRHSNRIASSELSEELVSQVQLADLPFKECAHIEELPHLEDFKWREPQNAEAYISIENLSLDQTDLTLSDESCAKIKRMVSVNTERKMGFIQS